MIAGRDWGLRRSTGGGGSRLRTRLTPRGPSVLTGVTAPRAEGHGCGVEGHSGATSGSLWGCAGMRELGAGWLRRQTLTGKPGLGRVQNSLGECVVRISVTIFRVGLNCSSSEPGGAGGGGVCRWSAWRLGPRPPPGAGPGVGKAGFAVTEAPPRQRPPTVPPRGRAQGQARQSLQSSWWGWKVGV